MRPPGRQGAGLRGRADQAPQRGALPARHHAGAGHHRRPHRRRVGHAARRPQATSATSRSSSARPTSLPTFKAAFLAILRSSSGPGVEELTGHELYALCDEEYAAADAWLERAGFAALIAAGAPRPREAAGEPRGRRARQGLRPVRRRLAARGGRHDLRRGGRRGHRVPGGRGRAARHDARRSGWPSPSGASFYKAREKARVDRRPRRLGLRARQDAGRLLPGARRHRLRHREVAGGGAVRRRALDGDQDRRPARREAVRRRHPRRVSRTRCWPTTSRPRSTGTPPG